MSARRSESAFTAEVFAALGDARRLALVSRLLERSPRSIAELSEGAKVTRQAVTKHLRVLEGAGLVRGTRDGREVRFELRAESLERAREYLEMVTRQWDNALERLKNFIESD